MSSEKNNTTKEKEVRKHYYRVFVNIIIIICYFINNSINIYSSMTSMKRPPIKISLIMFSLKQKRRKSIDLKNTVNVKSVMKSIQLMIGAEHATPVISAKTL